MRRMKHQKLNNSGAALVLVIVVIAFVSISATILLYMSAMNFFMKTTDIKTKDNFYSGEKALEEVRAVLIDKASDAVAVAYDKVLMNYGVSDPAALQLEFNKEFVKAFEKDWNLNCASTEADAVAAYLRQMINKDFVPSGKEDNLTVIPDAVTSKAYSSNSTKGTIKINTVEFTYEDTNGYQTKISTDFVIKAPTINFGMDPTSAAGKLGEKIEVIDYVNYSNWTKK